MANAVLRETVPTYSSLEVVLDARPSLWIALAAVVAIILTYFGYSGSEKRVLGIEAAAERAKDAMTAQNAALETRVQQLEVRLDEERRLRGVDVVTGLPNHIRFETGLAALLRGQAPSLLQYSD